MASRTEIVGIMRLLNQAYPDAKYEITDTLIDLWVAILGRYELAVLKAATVKLISESSFVPKVADIVKQIKSLASMGQPTAAEAWGMVSESLRKYGYYEQQKGREVLPPVVRQVVDMIGYSHLCESENVDVVRAQFMRMYQEMIDRQEQIAMLPAGVPEVVAALSERLNKAVEAGSARPEIGRGASTQSIGALLASTIARGEAQKRAS